MKPMNDSWYPTLRFNLFTVLIIFSIIFFIIHSEKIKYAQVIYVNVT